MRPLRFALLALCAAALSPSPATAQRSGDEESAELAWYRIEAGDIAEVVQARVVTTMRSRDGDTRLRLDGRERQLRGPIEVVGLGTGPEPMDYGGTASSVTTDTWRSPEGSLTVVTTITEIDDRTGEPTGKTTYVTTTINNEGEQTTTTRTEGGD